MLGKYVSLFKTYKESGTLHILISSFISQLSAFFLSFFVVRFLTQEEYGIVSFVQAFINFFLPLSGLGLNYSLLRFGANVENADRKKNLLMICVKYGVIFSIILYGLVCLLAVILNFAILDNNAIFYVLALLIFTSYLKDISQSFLRLNKNNREYAYSNALYSILLVTFSIFASYYWSIWGFTVAKVIVPLIVFVIIALRSIKSFNLLARADKENLRQYISYGVFIGLGSVASQVLFQIDQVILGLLSSDPVIVAGYKVATLIPFAVLFIPSSFMTADFVMIAEKSEDKQFLISYRRNITIMLFFISAVGLLISILFSKQILGLFYGQQYADSYKIMNILMFGNIAAFSLRTPSGNILAAVGKSKWNAILAYSTLGVNVALNFIFIRLYGAYGAAISTTIIIWVTSLIGYYLLNVYIKKETV